MATAVGVGLPRKLIHMVKELHFLNRDLEAFGEKIPEDEIEANEKENTFLEDTAKILGFKLIESGGLEDIKNKISLDRMIKVTTCLMNNFCRGLNDRIKNAGIGNKDVKDSLPIHAKWIKEEANEIIMRIFNIHVDRKLVLLDEEINKVKDKREVCKGDISNLKNRVEEIKCFQRSTGFNFHWGQEQLFAHLISEINNLIRPRENRQGCGEVVFWG